MKNFFAQPATDLTAPSQKTETRKGQLYVAYLNKAMIDSNAAKGLSNGYSSDARNYKESVFSTSSGSYYINGVPAILSQDQESMMYEDELSEYY